MQKYFYLYKITNKLNGKYYIGVHKTSNLDDNYMGSGKHLQNAKKKYGIENFEKEILEYFNTAEEMYLREAEIVNNEFLKLEETYNLKLGGLGGFAPGVQLKGSLIGIKSRILKFHENEEFRKKYSENLSFSIRKRIRDNGHWWLNKKHSEKTKQKMHETHKKNGDQQGTKNSCYGTCWIHSLNLKQSKRIKKEELDSYLALGWNQGRKMKF